MAAGGMQLSIIMGRAADGGAVLAEIRLGSVRRELSFRRFVPVYAVMIFGCNGCT